MAHPSPLVAAAPPARSGSSGRVAGAASVWVRERLAGPERAARVLHVGRDAAYVDVDGWCVGVLAGAARQVPCGIATTVPALSGLLGPEVVPGATASVGDGELALAGLRVHVGRLVDHGVPHLPAGGAPAPTDALTAPNAPVRRRLAEARAELPADALQALSVGEPRCVPALLGRGSGLTPLGDDVLAGWLATGSALDEASTHDRHPVATAVAEQARRRTTLLSATLLDCAIRGEVLPEFRRLLLAPTPAAARRALEALVGVGHTSGAGLALGAALAISPESALPEGRSA